jgi:uncharacterized protein (TIGR00730 family)
MSSHPIRAVCLYCGSSSAVPLAHRKAAARFGRIVAEAGLTLVYGGGRVGLMGLAADAALQAGGRVVGVIPRVLMEAEAGHGGVSQLHVVETMHERKLKMFDLSDGFVALPGGLGTLDETFEMLTWRQLGIHTKPIVIVSEKAYWRPLSDLVDAMRSAGYVREDHARMIRIVDSVEEALPELLGTATPAKPKAHLTLQDA